jgi:hypothetical protein
MYHGMALVMASPPDFAVEKSDLEHLADELGCQVVFTAKYHCKIAGEGVENGGGFFKKIYHCLPIVKKRYLNVFINTVNFVFCKSHWSKPEGSPDVAASACWHIKRL